MRVWIEIWRYVSRFDSRPFHPLMRVWIEIEWDYRYPYDGFVSPSYEGVDWNSTGYSTTYLDRLSFTLLWGCGLKLLTRPLKNMFFSFTLLWGCGLKYLESNTNERIIAFHPLMRVWIEMPHRYQHIEDHYTVSPSYEGVDWNPSTVWFVSSCECFTLLWGCGLKLPVFYINL